jgi:hypothetical protein
MVQENRIIHHSFIAEILLSSYFVLGFLLSVYGCIVQPELYGYTIALFCTLVTWIAWLRLDYVEVKPDGITRHYNFIFTRTLSWVEISKVVVVMDRGNRNKYSVLKLSSNNPLRKEVIINIKILSKRDVQWIADMLIRHTGGDICDQATKQIAVNWVA